MANLISELTGKLGIDEATANAAASRAFTMLRENVGDDLFSKITAVVPDAESLASQPAAQEQGSGGGMLGSLAGMASKALGGDAGKGLELTTELVNSGLPLDKLGPFVKTLIGFITQYVGDDVIQQVLAKFPMLKDLLDKE